MQTPQQPYYDGPTSAAGNNQMSQVNQNQQQNGLYQDSIALGASNGGDSPLSEGNPINPGQSQSTPSHHNEPSSDSNNYQTPESNSFADDLYPGQEDTSGYSDIMSIPQQVADYLFLTDDPEFGMDGMEDTEKEGEEEEAPPGQDTPETPLNSTAVESPKPPTIGPQPVPDNPLNFLNLVGTDFQPGRMVNIFFGLFIMLFMIIVHGYALWILGIAYLPGTRSLDEGQLKLDSLDNLTNAILDAIEYWENKATIH